MWSTIHSIPWVRLFPVSWNALEWIKLFSFVCVSDTMSFTSSTLFLVLIFVIWTLQATCYFSLLRYSRTWSNKIYFTSMAVLLAEVVKLFTMLVAIFFQCVKCKSIHFVSHCQFVCRSQGYVSSICAIFMVCCTKESCL